MKYNRFQQGDSVQYIGKKDSLRSSLAGREGFVDSRVSGEETLLCVSFGDNAYLLDEVTDLAKYVKRERVDHSSDRKGPDVQKRKGLTNKPKRSRNQDSDEE